MAAIASSFLLNLSLLAALLMILPGPQDRGWTHLSVWSRFGTWSGGVFLGFALAPGANVSWMVALSLAALTVAQGAALVGLSGMLGLVSGRYHRYARVGLALGCALVSTGLFWTKPLLSELKLRDYRVEVASELGDVTYWAPAAARAVFVLGPPTAVASVWNADESSFDLIRNGHTYRIWIGSWIIPYPRIWPTGKEQGSETGTWNQGLVIAFLVWGLVVMVGCDVMGELSPVSRALPKNPN